MPRVKSRAPRSGLPRVPRPPLRQRQDLDALAIAGEQISDNPRIRRSRLEDLESPEAFERSGADHARAAKRRRIESIRNDEEFEEDSDSEGHTWRLGVVDSDTDSHLDSDKAMNESDEERFADFAFRGSKAGRQTKRNTDFDGTRKATRAQKSRPHNHTTFLPHEDRSAAYSSASDTFEGVQDDEDSLGEDAIDLATALDMNDKDEQLQKTRQLFEKNDRTDALEDDYGSQTSVGSEAVTEDSEKESMLSFSDDSTDNVESHTKLQKFVDSLTGNISASGVQADTAFRHIEEEPSQFGARPSRKLTVAEILPTVTDPRLRQSLKILHNSEKDEGTTHRGGIPGKLAPPLTKRQQDQLDRAAAYGKSKETLDRWIDTVKHNRRAEHISFPLPDANAAALQGTKQLLPTSASQPITALENVIHGIMQESGFDMSRGRTEEEQIQVVEQLQERKMPREEVQARRAELRKQRDLMFREEKRARRIKKIKSKAYRRVHRKARDREAQQERQALAEAGLLNSEDERERNDRRRAEERMGARHRESRWAKSAKADGRTTWDEEAKQGVADMARRDEELRQRIQGRTIRDSEAGSTTSTSGADEDDDDTEDDVNSTRLQGLEQRLVALDETDDASQPSSNLASMKFMQRAEAARKAANDADLAQLRESITEDVDRTGTDADDSKPLSRQRFGSRNNQSQPAREESKSLIDFEEPHSASEGAEDLDDRGEDGVNSITSVRPNQPKSHSGRKSEGIATSSTSKVSQQRVALYSPWLSDAPKLKKPPNDDTLQINLNNQTTLRPKMSSTDTIESGDLSEKRTRLTPPRGADLTSIMSEPESDDQGDGIPNTEVAHTQEQLVRAGFAGDNVESDFANEKQELVQEEGDEVVDNTLPGWGSWAGEGISKREQKRGTRRFVTTIKGIDPSQRKDAKLAQVIINEKKVKKVRDAA